MDHPGRRCAFCRPARYQFFGRHYQSGGPRPIHPKAGGKSARPSIRADEFHQRFPPVLIKRGVSACSREVRRMEVGPRTPRTFKGSKAVKRFLLASSVLIALSGCLGPPPAAVTALSTDKANCDANRKQTGWRAWADCRDQAYGRFRVAANGWGAGLTGIVREFEARRRQIASQVDGGKLAPAVAEQMIAEEQGLMQARINQQRTKALDEIIAQDEADQARMTTSFQVPSSSYVLPSAPHMPSTAAAPAASQSLLDSYTNWPTRVEVAPWAQAGVYQTPRGIEVAPWAQMGVHQVPVVPYTGVPTVQPQY
jgi:hypothetical protein